MADKILTSYHNKDKSTIVNLYYKGFEEKEINTLLNNNKSKKYLGWRPILSINEMINFTISWYQLMKNNKSQLYDLSISQIKYFIKKI